MADPFALGGGVTSLVAGALGLVENLNKLITFLAVHDQGGRVRHIDPVLGELKILQSILAESVLMIQDQTSEPRASALDALARCEILQKELSAVLRHIGLDDARKITRIVADRRLYVAEQRLPRICGSFKSAILMLRDITTESVSNLETPSCSQLMAIVH